MPDATSPQAAIRLQSVVIAAHEPAALARFWARAIGDGDASSGQTGAGLSGGVGVAPTGAAFFVVFEPTEVAKTGQNRIHFDLTTSSVEDRDELIATLVANGATHVDVGQSPDEDHVVLADPEGNELCVLAPGNRFLAGCPRLGAVNCDGTAELGYFWSAALGWPLVWDQDEETAIQAPDGTGPKITWSGTPLMPRHGPERLHLHVAPATNDLGAPATGDLDGTVDALIGLGASRPNSTPASNEAVECTGAMTLLDPDGNPFCISPS